MLMDNFHGLLLLDIKSTPWLPSHVIKISAEKVPVQPFAKVQETGVKRHQNVLQVMKMKIYILLILLMSVTLRSYFQLGKILHSSDLYIFLINYSQFQEMEWKVHGMN